MVHISVSDARANLPKVIERAATEAIHLQRRGRPAAVVVSPERYEELLDALEELEDIAAYDAAQQEGGDNIPWEQVRVDLGWA